MQSVHIIKGNPQYCSNVAMKVNAKLGGTTSVVARKNYKTPPEHFRGPTVIIGADVSHATPGSPQASMAAITVSMDADACRYAATVQTNGHRVEMLTTNTIRTMMLPLVKVWMTKVNGGKPPAHLYYFRDGVSEGQYQAVLTEEVAEMKRACKDLIGVVPKFTVTICSKRHHIRFFPKDNDKSAGDRNGNPHPGVVVERDVVHPFQYDFCKSQSTPANSCLKALTHT